MELTKQHNILQPTIHFEYVEDFSKHLIDKMIHGAKLTEDGKVYSDSTIRQYKSFLRYFIEFQTKLYGAKLTFKEMKFGVAEKLKAFLNTKELTKNSVSAIMKKFKAVLSEAFKEEFCYWNGSGIKTPTELTTQISLGVNELRKMREAELSRSETHILEQYIIQSFTGLRYHTLVKFLEKPMAYIKEFEGNVYIDITDSKNGKQFIVPIGDTVNEILFKNDFKFITKTREHYARVMKEIAFKSGLDKIMIKTYTKGGKQVDFATLKSNMVSSHTARRTFATIMSKHFSKDEVANLTTHATVNQLNTYIREENIEKVKHLMGHKAFNQKI